MIKVIVKGDITRGEEYIIDENTTIKEFMEEQDMVFTPATLSIDGIILTNDKINNTFADMGVTDKCYFVRTAKSDNNVSGASDNNA